MSYNPEIYRKAQRMLQNRRDKAKHERDRRHREITEKFPQIAELEQEMADCGLSVIRNVAFQKHSESYLKSLKEKSLDAQKKRTEILTSNGYPADYLDMHYTCPVCNDTGFIDGKMCPCLSNLLKQLTYEKLSKSSPLQLSSFESFDLFFYPNEPDPTSNIVPRDHMRSVLRFCQNYADNFSTASESLLFFGATGLGKTHLSLAIANRAIEKGYGVIYGTAQNLLNQLEAEKFGRNTNGQENTQDMLLNCDLLILDDLGTEFSTAFTVSAIYNIVNTRILANLPTIISTNLDPKQLEQQYAQRIVSRIVGSYTPFYFCGRDIRQLKRNAQ